MAMRTHAVRALMWLVLGLLAALASPSHAAGAADGPGVRLLDKPAQITALQPFTVRFEAHGGTQPVDYVRVVFPMPTSVLLAEQPGAGCFARFDAERRELVYDGPAPPGWRASCTVRLVAQADASTQASLAPRLWAPPDHQAGDVATVPIETPPAPAALKFGVVGVTQAGLVVLGFLAAGGVLVAAGALWRGTAGAGLALLLTLTLGALLYFAQMAWQDWRTLQAWQPARCEVVDGNVQHGASRTAVSTTDRSSRDPGKQKASKPVLSLRYEAAGQTRQALGFATESRLAYTVQEVGDLLDQYQRAGPLPCWWDPEDPQRVVVQRGFGGAYLFALIPLAVLVLLGWLMPGRSRR